MAVEVLSSQDCLKDSVSRQALMNPKRNPNPNPSRVRSSPRTDRKSPRPTRFNDHPHAPVQKSPAPNNLVMGQVKILKRGEEVPKTAPNPPSPSKKNPNRASPKAPDLGSTNQLGPNPNLVPRKTKLAEPNRASGFYAGSSSCIASPPPSSLPLPSFFAKKGVASTTDEAARELLMLLRLNLS